MRRKGVGLSGQSPGGEADSAAGYIKAKYIYKSKNPPRRYQHQGGYEGDSFDTTYRPLILTEIGGKNK